MLVYRCLTVKVHGCFKRACRPQTTSPSMPCDFPRPTETRSHGRDLHLQNLHLQNLHLISLNKFRRASSRAFLNPLNSKARTSTATAPTTERSRTQVQHAQHAQTRCSTTREKEAARPRRFHARRASRREAATRLIGG